MGVVVRKQNGSWYVFINFQGNRKARKCASEHEARVLADELEALFRVDRPKFEEMLTPEDGSPRTTFAQHAGRWLAQIERIGLYHERTLRGHKHWMGNFWIPRVGHRDIRLVDRVCLKDALSSLVAAGRSKSTVRAALSTLRICLNEALDDGLIEANPSQGLSRVIRGARSPREIDPFDSKEIEAIIDAASTRHPLHRVLFLFLARTGCRCGEALQLTWDDIDFRKKTARIRKAKTPAGVRVVQMSPQLVSELRRWRAQLAQEALKEGREAYDYLWSHNGSPYDSGGVRYAFKRILKAAGVRYRNIHQLRHSFASIILSRDPGKLLSVSRQLGHSSPQITLTIYTHYIEQAEDRDALELLDEGAGEQKVESATNPQVGETGSSRK